MVLPVRPQVHPVGGGEALRADPRRVGNAHLHLHREDFNAKRKQVPGPAVTRG